MVDKPSPSFNYPIPGQGMTAEVGGRPWQNPPQYTTVEDALEFYIPRLTSEDVYDALLDSMELGIPLTTMADSMQSTAVMQGLHTIDVGILAMPVIIEMLAFIGDEAGIEYTLGTEKAIDEDKISESKIAACLCFSFTTVSNKSSCSNAIAASISVIRKLKPIMFAISLTFIPSTTDSA